MTIICRTCLQEVNETSITFCLNSTDSKSTTITVGRTLAYCVPEMDLDVVPNAVICNRCFESLTVAHEFKTKCLETEGRIQSYIEQMGYILTCINLKDIARQIPKNQTVTYNSSQDITSTVYDTNKNPILTPLIAEPREISPDMKNLQCDTKDFFAVPKIAQLLASTEKSYKCPRCSYTASNDLELKNHEKKHFDQELHKCNECEYSAPKRQTLIVHMRKHAGNKLYSCTDCGFDDKCILNRQPDDNHFKYDQGRLKFDFKTHLGLHTRDKPYKCLLCDYSSSHKTNLNHHMRIHTGEKTYKCKICNYRAMQKSNFQNHIKTHKPFKCNQCDYATAHNKSLMMHQKNHIHEKLYRCTFCTYSSSSKINLIKHVMVHTRQKSYQCFDCGYKSETKSSLKEHVDLHSAKKCQKAEDRSGESSTYETTVKNEMII